MALFAAGIKAGFGRTDKLDFSPAAHASGGDSVLGIVRGRLADGKSPMADGKWQRKAGGQMIVTRVRTV